MHVVEEMNAFMSDYETLHFLIALQEEHKWIPDPNVEENQKQKQRQNKPYHHPALQAITRDTVRYITQRSAANDESKDATDSVSSLRRMSTDQFKQLMTELNAFPLYKAEKLQIVNQLPTNMVHLYSIVEECDSRLNEGQVTALLESISRTCP